jgi:protein-S-isoprenylcysteine O-methyltransferase Ste14
MARMTHDENTFRILFVIIFCISIGISGYHRIKARTGEPLARREEGILVFAVLRLSGLVAALFALAYVINPRWLAWAQVPLPIVLRWLGAAIGLVCAAMLFWTLQHLGKNLTDTVVTRSSATLVTTGPYRWVRHPFYVAAALLFLAVFLVSANWVFSLPGTLVLSALAIRTPIEERHLLKRFGEEYRRYTERTGKFIPRLRR